MKINIIYWSGSGNTEAMANLIREGARKAGASVEVSEVSSAGKEQALDCDVLVLGCPAMGDEVLEESEFEPFMAALEGSVAGKKLALFGSYGWGDGQWMRDWSERMEGVGANLVAEGLIVNDAPSGASGDDCRKFGEVVARG